jgi:hypothetical protein
VRELFDKYASAFWTLLCGLALGFGLTWTTLGSGYGFSPLVAGPWVAWPQTGAPDVDPYARAAVARRGEAPLARDQGLVFVARADSKGEGLDGRCDYRIAAPVPLARFWTLELASPEGAPLANAGARYVLTSAQVLRREDGKFDIEVAPTARPGNWLSPGETRAFVLVLRLYDTPIDVAAKPNPAAFPSIVKQGCA